MPLQSEKLRLLRRIPDIRFEEEERGYSKDQVDRVLANLAPLADEMERVQARLAEAESRASSAESRLIEARNPSGEGLVGEIPVQPDFDETLRNTLVSAQRQADTTIREAREEAERLRTEAEFQSNALLADARDQSAEMTTEAVAYRERLMAEAASERARLLEEATSEAKGRVDAVETELAEAHDGERASLIAQITDLTGKHAALQGDVNRFEAHLGSRCDSVRAALAEITQVLDDPTSLRPNEPFEAADLEQFDAKNYPPIALEVEALDELGEEAAQAKISTAPSQESIDAAELVEVDLTGDEIDLDSQVQAQAEMAPTANGSSNGKRAEVPDVPVEQSATDPQLGVQTQVVPAPPSIAEPANDNLEVEAFAAEAEIEIEPEPEQSTPASGMPTWPAQDGPSDEAMNSFFSEEDDDGRGGGWFGRRR